MAIQAICAIEGCNKPVFQTGWCSMHYSRWRRHGTFESVGTAKGEPPAFFASMMKVETDECIVWPYARNKAGYGKIENRLVHRMACEEEHGPPPSPQHEAAHRPDVCHNPSCFNRRHLYWATPAENQEDRVVDGTSNRGGNYRNSKLTESQVREIRSMVGAGMLHHDIAAQFGVARTVVTRIANRTRWGWLE